MPGLVNGVRSIFGIIADGGIRGRRLEDEGIATALAIRHVACPYCSTIYPVMVLARNTKKIHRNPFTIDNSLNYRFKKTHLGNPIECPKCGKTFIVFASVERDKSFSSIRSINVRVARYEEPYISLMEWPHQGMVTREVIEYSPGREALLYEDLEAYLAEKGDIQASSMTNDNTIAPAQERGAAANSAPNPRRIQLR